MAKRKKERISEFKVKNILTKYTLVDTSHMEGNTDNNVTSENEEFYKIWEDDRL